MRPIVPILFILSALWLFGGSYWMSNKLCGSGTPGFSVNDGKFSTTSSDAYSFGFSSDKLAYDSQGANGVKASFQKIAKYLKSNEAKSLTLTGLYGDNEKNKTEASNLGLARAETIKAALVKLGAAESQITTSGNQADNLWYNDDRRVYNGVNFLFGDNGSSTSSTGGGEVSSDGEPTGAAGSMMLNVVEKGYDFSSVVGFDDYLNDLKSTITADPTKKVMVTAYNSDDALGSSIAKEVRRHLRNFGFGSSQVERSSGELSEAPDGKPGVVISIVE